MSTDPRQAAARLAAEVEAELERIGSVLVDLEEVAARLGPGCSGETRMAVAGYLHAAYTGCEAAMARIARAFDEMPTGERWHQALLLQSAAPREHIRPPVITPETGSALLDLLRFRHFFRNAYGVELSADKLAEHARDAPATCHDFAEEIRTFLTLLLAVEP